MLKEITRPPTVRDTVVDTLHQAIIGGDLRPGQPLLEAELSQSLNVARGTLREAFRILQRERLVEAFPHRGVFVATPSQEKVEELYSLRALLEPFAVGLAMGKQAYTDQICQEIEATIVRIEAAEQRGDELEMARADVDFHFAVCQPSEHWLLLDILRNLKALTAFYIAAQRQFDPPKHLDEQRHREILAAIQADEIAVSQLLIERVIIDAKERLLYRYDIFLLD